MDFIAVILTIIETLALPIGIVIWFIYSLMMFRRTPKEKVGERKNLRIQLIISGGLTLLVVIFVVWLIVVFSSPVSFM